MTENDKTNSNKSIDEVNLKVRDFRFLNTRIKSPDSYILVEPPTLGVFKEIDESSLNIYTHVFNHIKEGKTISHAYDIVSNELSLPYYRVGKEFVNIRKFLQSKVGKLS